MVPCEHRVAPYKRRHCVDTRIVVVYIRPARPREYGSLDYGVKIDYDNREWDREKYVYGRERECAIETAVIDF